MKTLKELREENVALIARAQALVNIATEEKRDLKPEEVTEVNSILGVENKGGLIADNNAKIETLEKLDKVSKECANNLAAKAFDDREGVKITPVAYTGPLNGYANAEQAVIAGHWAAATILNNTKSIQWCKDRGVPMNAMSVGSESSGGIFVPEELSTAIVRLVEEYGVIRSNVTVQPMASESFTFARRLSGITARWVGETPTTGVTDSNPTYAPAELKAKNLQAFSYVSMDLMSSATIAVANTVSEEMAYAFAYAEDEAGFNGDGTSTYGGIVGVKNALAAGSIHTAAAGNTAFGTLDLADFETMMGMLPRFARSGAKWYISPEGYAASMQRLMNAAGGNTMTDFGNGPQLVFQGKPVELVESMNQTLTAQVSTAGLVYYGNFRQGIKLGQKAGMEMMVYRELYARNRQIGLESTVRVDINVHERGTASAAGPIIGLSTPGA